MNPSTVALLLDLGFECIGIDPDAQDHHLYAQPTGDALLISVPAAGCSSRDIARLIFHAGARAARKDIATAHQAFLASIKV
jgi:hypothetical protein